jgi:hypothetical protein
MTTSTIRATTIATITTAATEFVTSTIVEQGTLTSTISNTTLTTITETSTIQAQETQLVFELGSSVSSKRIAQRGAVVTFEETAPFAQFSLSSTGQLYIATDRTNELGILDYIFFYGILVYSATFGISTLLQCSLSGVDDLLDCTARGRVPPFTFDTIKDCGSSPFIPVDSSTAPVFANCVAFRFKLLPVSG